MPAPGLADAPGLAFELLGVPLALDNAFRSVASRVRLACGRDGVAKFEQARTQLLDAWTRAVNEAPDTDGPSAIGLFDA